MTNSFAIRSLALAFALAFSPISAGSAGRGASVAWSAAEVDALADEVPVAAEDAGALARTLPRKSGLLLEGGAFTILAIGDSVTATGPYPEILARLLARTTGNKNIRVVRAAYPGKSTDAALRRWAKDIAPVDPDLALVMFGLNDQAAGMPLAAYREQMRWLVERLRAEAGADVVLLEPTPHIEIALLPGTTKPPQAEAWIFRTAGFGAALRELGAELAVPVAPTFGALWGGGGPDLQAAARAMWPLYPRSHKEPFSSLTETNGKGDTIHPNARGHLAMARAVFDTLLGRHEDPPLRVVGETRREDGRRVSRLEVKNVSDRRRSGRLALYPYPGDETRSEHDYDLEPGATAPITFVWPGPRSEPVLQLVDFSGEGNRATAVTLPFHGAWVEERTTVADGVARARKNTGEEFATTLPRDAAIGRVALEGGGELVFARYARASEGEIEVDGRLGEWAGAEWVPVGEPGQARSTRGVRRDFRATAAECYLRWAFRAGREGVHLAFRGTGALSQDRFTVLFDPRAPTELGTAGPYFWIDGTMGPDGKIALRAGDSSPAAEGLRAVWRAVGADGAEGELFVPYGVMGARSWPESGDLGVSILWMHRHADGNTTRLAWTENGYAWTPRWFGVVRRGSGELPWMVRTVGD